MLRLLMPLAAALACASAAAGDFYAPVPDRAAALPEKGIYPRGRRMAFMGYSGDPARDLPRGFTAAGPAYKDEPQYLAKAFREGWPVVAHVGHGISFKDGAADKFAVVEASVAARIGAEVRALAAHPEIVWWALKPEELRPWRRDELRYLATAAAAIRANDPLGRPIYHYNPNNRTAPRLKLVAPYVDIIAKGAYVNSSGFKRDRAWVARGMAELTAAAPRGTVALVMPELYRDPEPSEDGEIRAWARHDVYAGLVGGAKGVLIWSLFKRKEVRRTWKLWYDAYAECAAELAGPNGLAQVFLFGEPRRDLTVSWEGGAGADHAAAEFAHGAGRWLFIVNSGNAPAAFSVAGFPPGSRIRDAFTGEPASARRELPAYGVAALRFDRKK